MRRRNSLTATTGTAAAVVVPIADSRPTSVGTSDVIRLRSGLDALVALDAARGGHEDLEHADLAPYAKTRAVRGLAGRVREVAAAKS
ncbi:hypothetical protein [Streptomyces sp. JNUCC 63]